MAGECGAMSKACDRILASVREARAWARGEPVEGFRVHVPDSIDVAAIRDRAGLSQARFAAQIGVPVATLRNWESGRRRPDGPARVPLPMNQKTRPNVLEHPGTAALRGTSGRHPTTPVA